MAWEADGRKLEKVVHAMLLKPELPADAPPERQALQAMSKPLLICKLQRVSGKLVWKLERASDAAVQDSGLERAYLLAEGATYRESQHKSLSGRWTPKS